MDTNREMTVQFSLGDRGWELDPYDLTVDEAIALQRVTGRTWADLCLSMETGDAEALKAFLWAARRHAGEDLRYDAPEMNFRWREFTHRRITAPQPQPAVG